MPLKNYMNHQRLIEPSSSDLCLIIFLIRLKEIFEIVKELFCIVPSSVPAESLFSIAGLIQNGIRNRLNPMNLEKLTFIKTNSIRL